MTKAFSFPGWNLFQGLSLVPRETMGTCCTKLRWEEANTRDRLYKEIILEMLVDCSWCGASCHSRKSRGNFISLEAAFALPKSLLGGCNPPKRSINYTVPTHYLPVTQHAFAAGLTRLRKPRFIMERFKTRQSNRARSLNDGMHFLKSFLTRIIYSLRKMMLIYAGDR